MLTRPQVENFLTSIIRFDDWESVLQGNKEEFLFKFVQQAQRNLFWQNITWGALAPEDRKKPTAEESVALILDFHGGACIQMNYMVKLVLENLGFDAFLAPAEAPCSPGAHVPWNHAVTAVKLGEKTYLIEIGFARPIAEPINLSSLPYRTKEGGFEVEVRFNAEKNLYERVLLNGCPLTGSKEPDYVDYVFKVEPWEFEDFKDLLRDIFIDPTKCFFLNSTLLFRFTRLESKTDYEYVAFCGRRMVQGTAFTRTEITYSSYRETFPVIMEWFPKIHQETLRTALYNYDHKKGQADE